MNILVIGSGGREHAIVWKLSQSPQIERIYCAPGNGGISALAECIPVDAMDQEGIIAFARENGVGMVVVAPDDPLADGMVDALEDAGLRALGPKKKAAEIESSKAFSKDLMKKYNIPTAGYEVFDDSHKAIEYIEKQKCPIVVKADGLALGKGVLICRSRDEAIEGVKSIMEDRKFGEAGSRVVIEEFIEGPEVSILAFTDGKTIVPMVSAQDHKRALDGDKGLNTGGMGTFSPSRIYTGEIAEYCMRAIYKPTIAAMEKEGRPFKGILFFGLMITKDGPKVLEYNARFGDPETQVVLPRLKSDLLDIFNSIIDEKLDQVEIKWDDNAAVCVIMASGGYPVKYQKGYEIKGLTEAGNDSNIVVFHAGSKKEDGKYITNGGRVLGVTAMDENLDKAIKRAYEGVEKINFKDAHYRKDIGIK